MINTRTGTVPRPRFPFVVIICEDKFTLTLRYRSGTGMVGYSTEKESRDGSIKNSSLSEHPCLPQGPDSKANLRSVGPVSCH